MQTHEQYYQMVHGDWAGTVVINITQWRPFLHAPLSLINKVRFVMAVLTQKAFGPYTAKTQIAFSSYARTVAHLTQLFKWGICLYEGREFLTLDRNGTDLALEGYGGIWPLVKRQAVVVEKKHGHIDASATSATYEICMLGLEGHITTRMSIDKGTLHFQNEWFEARFDLHRVKKNT